MHHPNSHETHDVTLIAGHAADDLVDSDRVRAQELLSACPACAELHTDLLAIASATHALPNLARAPRDFRLDPAQAARLHRGSWLRAALRSFGSTGFALKPLATAFTSAGVAGLLVVTVLPALLGSSSAAGPQRELATENQSAASAAPVAPGAAAGAPAGATNAPVRADLTAATAAPSTDPVPVFGVKDSASQGIGGPVAIAGGPETPEANAPSDASGRLGYSDPPNPILIGSLALLGVGLALFGLRFASRRLR